MNNFFGRFWSPGRRPEDGPEAEEIKALSDQFRVTLKAAVRKIEAGEQSRETLEPIEKLLDKEDWRWKDAYEVEQSVVLLYDEETLRTELSRRVLEAQQVLYPNVAAWYQERANEVQTSNEQRALLLRLVNDLQWRYTVNEAKLGYVKQITGRTGWIFILAVVTFIGFLFFFLFATRLQAWINLQQFLTFLLAAVSGFMGASFSMVASLKTRLESSSINQMKNASSRAILLSRVLVGTGAAMILYFFFESELLTGAAFPNLMIPLPPADEVLQQRALLIVWCFIAGFSEKLVPGLLAKTEAQAIDQAQSPPHGSASREFPPTSGTITASLPEKKPTNDALTASGESSTAHRESGRVLNGHPQQSVL